MRTLLFVCLLCAPALASAPGEPADCNDWQLLEPGLGCEILTADWPCLDADPWCSSDLSGFVQDNTFASYFMRAAGGGVEVVRLAGEAETVVARLTARAPDEAMACGPSGTTRPRCLAFHSSGRLVVAVSLSVWPATAGVRVFALSGLASLHDLALSFDPAAQSFGLRVPVSPEGLGQADVFNVYTGPVTRPLGLENGAPFRCGIPGSEAGSWVRLGDLPAPGPGAAVWILSTVGDDGITRAGREAPAGVLRGRDPARLPECPTRADPT